MERVRKMFRGICSSCGSDCEIPFEPIENRPFKCKSCFYGKSNRKFKRRDFEVICEKCGRETTVPFKPVQGRPVLCRECFKAG